MVIEKSDIKVGRQKRESEKELGRQQGPRKAQSERRSQKEVPGRTKVQREKRGRDRARTLRHREDSSV